MDYAVSVPKLVVSAEEAREMLNMGETTFERLYRSGKLKVLRNGRRVLFSVEELQRYIRENLTTYTA